MSDTLSQAVSFDYLHHEVIATITGPKGQRHQWLWLTKRPQRMARFSDWLKERGVVWPANLWTGTSIPTQETTARIGELLKVGDEQTLPFLSTEPQVEAIDVTPWLPELDWVIQGGESGAAKKDDSQRAREFKLEWAFDMKERCRAAGVPFFLKQLGRQVSHGGRAMTFKDGHGGDWTEWPEELRVREMPMSGAVNDVSPLGSAKSIEYPDIRPIFGTVASSQCSGWAVTGLNRRLVDPTDVLPSR